MAVVVTNAGKSFLVQTMTGVSLGIGSPLYMAIGSGPGSASASALSLFSELSPAARVAASFAVGTTIATNDSLTFVSSFTPGVFTLTNVGVFTATSGGQLLVMADLAGASVVLNAGDTITLTLAVAFLQ